MNIPLSEPPFYEVEKSMCSPRAVESLLIAARTVFAWLRIAVRNELNGRGPANKPTLATSVVDVRRCIAASFISFGKPRWRL